MTKVWPLFIEESLLLVSNVVQGYVHISPNAKVRLWTADRQTPYYHQRIVHAPLTVSYNQQQQLQLLKQQSHGALGGPQAMTGGPPDSSGPSRGFKTDDSGRGPPGRVCLLQNTGRRLSRGATQTLQQQQQVKHEVSLFMLFEFIYMNINIDIYVYLQSVVCMCCQFKAAGDAPYPAMSGLMKLGASD